MLAAALIVGGCRPRAGDEPAELPGALSARREIWVAIQPMAASRGLDPLFVFALVKIESRYDPHAKHGENRGLLQIKPRAWKAVSEIPYEAGVWDWRTNLAVGMDGLVATKRALEGEGRFTYPVLWASYHYGYDYVAARGFDVSRIPSPSDPIAHRIWSGEIHPIDPPK